MNLNYDLLSLSVNMQAQAMLPVVVNILGLFDENGCFEKVSARITPLYNGRERGYVLTLSTNALIPHDPPPLHVFFAEDRHSDALFVWSWEAPVLEVPPRLPNDFDQSFMARRSSASGWTALRARCSALRPRKRRPSDERSSSRLVPRPTARSRARLGDAHGATAPRGRGHAP